MSTLQTSYRRSDTTPTPGQIIDRQLAQSASPLVEGDPIAAGKAAFAGSDDANVTATPSDRFAGIVYRDQFNAPSAGDEYTEGATVPVAMDGVIAVPVAGSVAKGAQVYSTAEGDLTSSAADNFEMRGARFDATGSGVVPLRLSRVRN